MEDKREKKQFEPPVLRKIELLKETAKGAYDWIEPGTPGGGDGGPDGSGGPI